MNSAVDMGPDWLMAQHLEEQEQRAEETLRLIYAQLVVPKKLERERFNELCYLTGCRAKFD
jgi:hypothetical protein